MPTSASALSRLRFDRFEVDPRSGELWENGARLRLQEQPFQVLRMLLEHQGEVVTRDELRQRVWAADIFVDFDDGLNTAIKKIRDILSDSAERPRYIETIPRRGYRFIGPVEPIAAPPGVAEVVPTKRRARLAWVAALPVLVVIAGAVAVWSWRPRTYSDTARIRAIAVLPLQNLSGDPADDYFAAGITDALTTELARTAGSSLRVTSRTSAEKYKNKPLAQIARELDVDAVVEGSLVKTGNRARITAQLLNARTNRHLWAASYDRDLHDILGLETEIAATIARHVQVTLSPRAEARLAAPIITNPEAYDLYQRGRYRAFSNNPADLAQAITLLEQAVRLESNLAVAHAMLGRVYRTQAFLVDPEQQRLDTRAAEEINRALQLDPDLADAYLVRGAGYWTHRNGFPAERAIREIKHALELDPSLVEAHHQLGEIFLHVGLLGEAEQELRTALQLDPTNLGVRYRIAVTLLDQGRMQQAIAGFEGTRIFFPKLWPYQMALALFQVGRKQEAAALIRDYLRDDPRDEGGVGNAMQALLYADDGQAQLAENSIQAAIAKGRGFGHFHHAAYTIGEAYAVLGRPKDAVGWLRAAADDGFPCYPLYARDHSLDKVRNDAEFREFMADLKKRWEHIKAIT